MNQGKTTQIRCSNLGHLPQIWANLLFFLSFSNRNYFLKKTFLQDPFYEKFSHAETHDSAKKPCRSVFGVHGIVHGRSMDFVHGLWTWTPWFWQEAICPWTWTPWFWQQAICPWTAQHSDVHGHIWNVHGLASLRNEAPFTFCLFHWKIRNWTPTRFFPYHKNSGVEANL